MIAEICGIAVVVSDRATHIDLRIVASNGTTLGSQAYTAQVPLSPAGLAQQIAALLQRAIHQQKNIHITRLVCSIDAILANEKTVQEYGPMPAWRSVDIASQIRDATGIPTSLATHTESMLAAVQSNLAIVGHAIVLYVDVSRMITASLSIDGRIIHRPHLGDIGHVQVRTNGIKCRCGGYGHLVTVASAQSMVREMIGRMVEYPETTQKVLEMAGGAERLSVQQIWQLSCEGDPVAQHVIEESIIALASVFVTIILMLDPTNICIGGTIAACGNDWLRMMKGAVTSLLPADRRQAIEERMQLVAYSVDDIRRGTGILANNSAEVLWIVS